MSIFLLCIIVFKRSVDSLLFGSNENENMSTKSHRTNQAWILYFSYFLSPAALFTSSSVIVSDPLLSYPLAHTSPNLQWSHTSPISWSFPLVLSLIFSNWPASMCANWVVVGQGEQISNFWDNNLLFSEQCWMHKHSHCIKSVLPVLLMIDCRSREAPDWMDKYMQLASWR